MPANDNHTATADSSDAPTLASGNEGFNPALTVEAEPLASTTHSEPGHGNAGVSPASAGDAATGAASSDAAPVVASNENFARVHVLGVVR